MISESGPRWQSEDETPTQVFEAVSGQDDAAYGLVTDEPVAAREEHGLAALLARDEQSVLPPRNRERRTVKLTAALGVVVLAVIGIATYEVISGLGHSGKTTIAIAAHASARSAANSPAQASPSPAASASASATPSRPAAAPALAPVRTLRPVSATAVGPGGRTGDDPQGAANVLSGAARTPWQTDWYTTSLFGGLQTGTGLLIDLGASQSVSSVTVALSDVPGADFQVRAGQSVTQAELNDVAISSGASGTVQLSLGHPVQARYLVIWFTKLPPNGAGTYQVKVYHVTVRGS